MPDYVESYDGNIERKVEICKSSGKLSFVVRQTGNLSNWSLKSFYQFLLYVFLPQGYPHSVSDDYLNYQKWDTLQAFASSITGALATEAVLRGAGVGNDVNSYNKMFSLIQN